ncbi:MAG: small ribosomal subunit Rsm22 family protein [Bryobacteraceae bacterium]|jgi:ribosomal protein RSM22 (predicted rRNA methylase)
MQLPIELAEAIGREAARHDRGALARAVAAVSSRYHAAAVRATGRLSEVEHAAYLAVRMPAIYGALRAVFAELGERIPDTPVRTLLDLGAGPGTAAWAAAAAIPALAEITCVERDRGFIAVGRRLASTSPHEAVREARWLEADLRAASPLPLADVVVLSYVTGEIEGAARLIERAWCAARIAVIVIEPGTPRGFAAIRTARDQLIRAAAAIAAPCPHADECPMKDPDWCHFAARIERTRLHRQLKGGELGHEDEKFSYVIASRVPARSAESRIVRHPWTEPGLVRLELCTVEGLRTRAVRKREGEAFRRARKAQWAGEWADFRI